MRVGFLSYPMLFQRSGGLQVQILETIKALNDLGITAELVDVNRHKLTEFDLIHVFSIINGNHRIVEAVKSANRPAVVSPLVRPSWTGRLGQRAQLADRIVGRLTRWEVQTTYRHMKLALELADTLVALGDIERDAIIAAFKVSSNKITVVPNGISERFFSGDAMPFSARYGLAPGFALNVAAINPHKNQRALVDALEGSGMEIVLIGECLKDDMSYLAELEAHPRVHYIGVLSHDDPLLASAYAAAKVFVLPSHDEVMPLAVLEALAAGTPVVMTKNHCMTIGDMKHIIAEIDPYDNAAIKAAALDLSAKAIPRAECQEAMQGFTWQSVARKLIDCYRRLA